MKKRKLKSLELNKKSISNLSTNNIKGGFTSIYWCQSKRPCNGDDANPGGGGSGGGSMNTCNCDTAGCATNVNSGCAAC